MPKAPWMVLPFALLLAACGPSEGGGADAGTTGPTDEAYFGLQNGTCYGLLGGVGGLQEMTVGVEEETSALGYPAKVVRYRLGGIARRTDYVTVEGGQVLIHRREVIGQGSAGYQVEFDPPVVWLERPVRETGTEPIVTETTATDAATLETATWTVDVNVAAPENLTVPYQTEAIEAHPVYVAYARSDTGTREQDRLWVAPETGFVRFDLSGNDWPEMSLASKWQMQEGDTQCTSAP